MRWFYETATPVSLGHVLEGGRVSHKREGLRDYYVGLKSLSEKGLLHPGNRIFIPCKEVDW